MKMRHDLVPVVFGIVILLVGLTFIYGAFWWVNAFVTPMLELTFNEVLQQPLLRIVFMIATNPIIIAIPSKKNPGTALYLLVIQN